MGDINPFFLQKFAQSKSLDKIKKDAVYTAILFKEAMPSHGQARRIRELSRAGKFKYIAIEEMLKEKKGCQNERISFNRQKIEQALPFDMAKRDKRYIEEYIINALREYNKSFAKKNEAAMWKKIK